MLDEFAVEHAQVGLSTLAIDPKVAEHLATEIEKGHVVFPVFSDGWIAGQYEISHNQQRFPDRSGLPVVEFFEHIHLTKLTAI